jgi:hypothetical protein
MRTVNPNISNISPQKERPVRSDDHECVPVLSLHVSQMTSLEIPGSSFILLRKSGRQTFRTSTSQLKGARLLNEKRQF